MLQIQKEYIDYIGNIEVLLKNTNIDINDLDSLKKEIDAMELIVPVVGGFSAGKSTLINSFLGTNTLPTNLTPETALATELRYSNSNYIEAIKSDDSIVKYDINQSEEIKNNAKDYKYIKLFLNNNKLKSIEPLILVDMPGFDSPLELHNQAILNYLNKGIYFILLTSIEDGNITKSMMRELNNISDFGKDFSFCLSKTNLRPKSDIDNVKEIMQEQLEDYFNFEKDVIPVDDNGGENLNKILHQINVEKLFESVFIDELKNNFYEKDISINTILSTLRTSKDEVVIAINELKSGIDKIINRKNRMINEAKNRYSDNSSNSIIEAVSRELLNQKSALINLGLSNPDSFGKEINEIVKSTLIYEIKSKMQNVSSDIVNSFTIELNGIGDSLATLPIDENWIKGIGENTINILEQGRDGLNDILEKRQNTEKNNKSVTTTFQTITTILGITTNILNPILELVIVFLPNIISFFTGKPKEEQLRDEISNKFISEVIPLVKMKLREVLPTLMEQQINTVIESISNEFESQLKQKEQEIDKTQQEKENNIQDIEEKINILENIQQELKTLATQILYKKDK